MKMKLQTYSAGEWATLNTRHLGGTTADIDEVMRELTELQSRWQTNYDRFKGAPFRIIQED